LKIKLTYFIWLAILLNVNAQKLDLNLEKGQSILFNQNIYAFGFKSNAFMVYKMSQTLQLKDSVSYGIDKAKITDFASIDFDTLHQTLNFYLQKKDKQNTNIIRYDSKLNLVNDYKNIEITKLNPLTAFDHQTFFHKKNVYAVKSVTDSTGKQYYLSKFTFQTSLSKPFDYKFVWQFNFEKRYIENINIFYVDTNFVLAYVNINNGERKGQWLLKINAVNGLLIKGKKLNGNTNLNYRYSNYVCDSITKELFIMGQITQGEKLASPTPSLFVIQFDSLLNISSQKTVAQKINLANPKSKILQQFIFQVNLFKIKSPQSFEYHLDFYKGNTNEFTYCNSSKQEFMIDNEGIITEPVLLKEYLEIENYLFTQDKKDLNGKLFTDTTKSADRLFYIPPIFQAKQLYKINEDGFPVWALKKTDLKTNTVNYSILKPGKKVYETVALLTVNKEDTPALINISKTKFVLSYTKNSSLLHLEISEW